MYVCARLVCVLRVQRGCRRPWPSGDLSPSESFETGRQVPQPLAERICTCPLSCCAHVSHAGESRGVGFVDFSQVRDTRAPHLHDLARTHMPLVLPITRPTNILRHPALSGADSTMVPRPASGRSDHRRTPRDAGMRWPAVLMNRIDCLLDRRALVCTCAMHMGTGTHLSRAHVWL